MKKIVLSITAAAMMSSLAIAGGDITPAAPANDVSGPYAGLGLSYADTKTQSVWNNGQDISNDDTHMGGGQLLLGYRYNEYLGFEGRYTYVTYKDNWHDANGESGSVKYSVSNIGFYLKPQYSFGNMTAYALAGYGWTNYEQHDTTNNGYKWGGSDTHGGFQWGVGLSLSFSEHASLYIDYTEMADGAKIVDPDTGDTDEVTKFSSFNVGMIYKF